MTHDFNGKKMVQDVGYIFVYHITDAFCTRENIRVGNEQSLCLGVVDFVDRGYFSMIIEYFYTSLHKRRVTSPCVVWSVAFHGACMRYLFSQSSVSECNFILLDACTSAHGKICIFNIFISIFISPLYLNKYDIIILFISLFPHLNTMIRGKFGSWKNSFHFAEINEKRQDNMFIDDAKSKL